MEDLAPLVTHPCSDHCWCHLAGDPKRHATSFWGRLIFQVLPWKCIRSRYPKRQVVFERSVQFHVGMVYVSALQPLRTQLALSLPPASPEARPAASRPIRRPSHLLPKTEVPSPQCVCVVYRKTDGAPKNLAAGQKSDNPKMACPGTWETWTSISAVQFQFLLARFLTHTPRTPIKTKPYHSCWFSCWFSFQFCSFFDPCPDRFSPPKTAGFHGS